jgi:two-component system NtrC family sensor kinase
LSGLANLTAAAILEAHNRQAAATLSKELAQMEEQQRSLTERLNYVEAGMLQAARLAAVGQLAASIAHEINNPLYAARNGLYLIEDDLPEELRSSPYLRMVSDQLARIAGIIERMRDFYRPTRGELAPADINQLLEETLALAGLNSRHGGINMIFTPAQELPLVQGNADQLRQVFLNLVLNAIEAMPNGGTLTVRTEAGPSVVLIEIQDTGVGIPDDIRPHLFEPFFTNKPNGTGLGLSISAHIVTQHGGHIDVESAPGQGTTFRLVLPYQSIVR